MPGCEYGLRGAVTGHENCGRSIYQPSLSMLVSCCEHASGDDCIDMLVLTRRAVRPYICLRSPVSTIEVVIVTVPPLAVRVPACSGGALPAGFVSSTSVANG